MNVPFSICSMQSLSAFSKQSVKLTPSVKLPRLTISVSTIHGTAKTRTAKIILFTNSFTFFFWLPSSLVTTDFEKSIIPIIIKPTGIIIFTISRINLAK